MIDLPNAVVSMIQALFPQSPKLQVGPAPVQIGEQMSDGSGPDRDRGGRRGAWENPIRKRQPE